DELEGILQELVFNGAAACRPRKPRPRKVAKSHPKCSGLRELDSWKAWALGLTREPSATPPRRCALRLNYSRCDRSPAPAARGSARWSQAKQIGGDLVHPAFSQALEDARFPTLAKARPTDRIDAVCLSFARPQIDHENLVLIVMDQILEHSNQLE